MTPLRIGTRKSALALWQAEYVRDRLRAYYPDLAVELIKITTEGDRILDRPLATVGGKGLFIKELEQALFERRIDIAVHSMKDLTVTLPPGLHVAAVCERADPRDAFVSTNHRNLAELPTGARVGTSSLRRQCQLRARYPHLSVVDLRGNVNTRLAKLDAGDYDAIILAAAGLRRLGFENRIRQLLSEEESLPAVGQGAVCIESRVDDGATNERLAVLEHGPTRLCVTAERAFNAALEGGCQVPIGGYAERRGNEIHLRGLVGDPDGSRLVQGEIRGPERDAVPLGQALAADLLDRGAKAILDKVYRRGGR